jgi:hypothetical protein
MKFVTIPTAIAFAVGVATAIAAPLLYSAARRRLA